MLASRISHIDIVCLIGLPLEYDLLTRDFQLLLFHGLVTTRNRAFTTLGNDNLSTALSAAVPLPHLICHRIPPFFRISSLLNYKL